MFFSSTLMFRQLEFIQFSVWFILFLYITIEITYPEAIYNLSPGLLGIFSSVLHIQFSVVWKSALVSKAGSSSPANPSPIPNSAWATSTATLRGIRKERLQKVHHILYKAARCFGSFAVQSSSNKSVIVPFYEVSAWASALSHQLL